MSTALAFHREAGKPFECPSIPVELRKRQVTGPSGEIQYRCGFRIGGGIDQDPSKSPYGYPDSGIYITHIEPGGPAEAAKLKVHDKILQVNGYDFTMVTHEKAINYIKKYNVLKMLVARQK
ncbi:unnamed protein product [Soboliphyme baturini]|uniref:PDZ domain-containing protein n=1 Tax=Soboliphyme baturini TaxID=241478 RepID=A0A183IV26_9BILA|nr:unnamed protein product [Soboliphyme baturini]